MTGPYLSVFAVAVTEPAMFRESYDGTGNIYSYAYDSNGRLTSTVLPGGSTVGYWFGDGTTPTGYTEPGSYQPGKNSNRLCTTNGTSATATFAYDRADRLTASTATGYTGTISYDTHGNVTAIGAEVYGYDGADRHLSTSNGTTTSVYVRDLTDQVVEYKLNEVTQNRYSGNTTLDATGATVVERTVGLPGGVTLTTRSGGDVWSYPNIAGSITTTANSTGAKTAGPLLYDPYGNPLSSYPDNQTGLLDNAWMGQHDRQTQHQTGLRPAVDMGARQYHPQLGRFTETDPVEGGGANDYGYPTDPINGSDLSGLCNAPTVECVIGILTAREELPDGFLAWEHTVRHRVGKSPVYFVATRAGARGGLTAGSCSVPGLGDRPALFRHACRTHDLGYDLMRFFGSTGSLGSVRRAVDRMFNADMKSACGGLFILQRSICNRTASLYYTVVQGNSLFQRYTTP